MKKPDKLILIAVWQFITAFMLLIGIAAVVIGYMDGRIVFVGGGGPFWLSVYYILPLLCFMALAIVGGVGLMLNRGRAWARMVSIVHSALSLFAIPVGTIIGTLSIIYLAKQEVRDYFNPPPPKA